MADKVAVVVFVDTGAEHVRDARVFLIDDPGASKMNNVRRGNINVMCMEIYSDDTLDSVYSYIDELEEAYEVEGEGYNG